MAKTDLNALDAMENTATTKAALQAAALQTAASQTAASQTAATTTTPENVDSRPAVEQPENPTKKHSGSNKLHQTENRAAWHRALGLAEPIMGALAASPGILASEVHFSESTQQISAAIQSVAKILKKEQNIPGMIGSMVAAPLCAASWQIQAEKQKKPELNPDQIADIAMQFNAAMGDVEFPARQMPYIARELVEHKSAAALFGTNYRETLHGMAGVIQGEVEKQGTRPETTLDTESHEYFLARLSAFPAEQIGAAIHSARAFMTPEDKNDVPGWHTLAFWGETAKDEKAREMLELALATQIAVGNGWYDRVHHANPELCKVLVKKTRAEDTVLLARAAREYADRVEGGADIGLTDVDKLSMVMCTAMREGMTVFHDVREKIFTATENMLQKKYPEAKTAEAMQSAMVREAWPERVKAAYQSGKTLREGIFSGIHEGATPMEMSVSMKIRAAVGAAVAPLLKPGNLNVLKTAFPFIPEDASANDRCRVVVDWGEKAVKEVAWATVEVMDIPRLDQPTMQGSLEKVLQATLKHTDIVTRCAKQGRAADIFPEMVKELCTVVQVSSGMVAEPVRKRADIPLQGGLSHVEEHLCAAFRDTERVETLPRLREESDTGTATTTPSLHDAVA